MEQDAVATYYPLLFLTISQLCIQKDQTQAEYQAALQYICSEEIHLYIIHYINWSVFLSVEEVLDYFKLSRQSSQVGAEVDMHYDTHTQK